MDKWLNSRFGTGKELEHSVISKNKKCLENDKDMLMTQEPAGRGSHWPNVG